MNAKACAPSNKALDWKTINWKKAEAYVKKLQMRIVKAQKELILSRVLGEEGL